jgi:hypothetical protein
MRTPDPRYLDALKLRVKLGAVDWLSMSADEALTAYKLEGQARIALAKLRANPKGT